MNAMEDPLLMPAYESLKKSLETKAVTESTPAGRSKRSAGTPARQKQTDKDRRPDSADARAGKAVSPADFKPTDPQKPERDAAGGSGMRNGEDGQDSAAGEGIPACPAADRTGSEAPVSAADPSEPADAAPAGSAADEGMSGTGREPVSGMDDILRGAFGMDELVSDTE